jgi:TPR repeat protein
MKLLILVLLFSCSSKHYCSNALRSVAEEDQRERQFFFDMKFEQLNGLSRRDKQRRERVKELAGRGCLRNAENYSHAALVFQHGDRAKDFLQAFKWSKKAVELGDQRQSSMMAMALDRYLVKSGDRQLFGTQATKGPDSSCWCLEKTEKEFSDETRKSYTGKTLADQEKWLKELNHNSPQCSQTYCDQELGPAPKGFLAEW